MSVGRGGWRALCLGFSLLALSCGAAPRLTRPPAPALEPGMGLVVGEVAAAEYGFQELIWQPQIVVSGGKVGRLINGLMVFALEPGSYVLDRFERTQTTGSGTSTFSGVTVHVVSSETVKRPVQLPFTVRAGKITNLGLILLRSADPGGALPIRIENGDDMAHLLDAFYPQLRQSLARDFEWPTGGVIADAETLNALRRGAVVAASKHVRSPQCCIASDFGAVAELVHGPVGELTALDLLEAKFASGVESSDATLDRGLFLTRSGRLFLVQDGRVRERAPPRGLRAPQIAVGPQQNVVIVDEFRKLYLSGDDGQTWRAVRDSSHDQAGSYFVSAGVAGYYVHRYDGSELHFGSYDGSALRKLELPGDLDGVGAVHETSSGLFVQSEFSGYYETSPRPFYVRDKRGAWLSRSMPAANCNELSFADGSGNALLATCGDRAPPVVAEDAQSRYASSDGGKTWKAR